MSPTTQEATAPTAARDLFREYITQKEFAEQRGCSLRALQLERQARRGPPWIKIGRQTMYSIVGIRAWLTSLETGALDDTRRPRRGKRAA